MIGRRLSHYVLLAPLGSGGMGEVYRARDEHLERDVAIKLLPVDALAEESARRRFRREALALSRLAHPHINVVHDFDRDGDVDFLVMELVPGETLAGRLEKGPVPENEALVLVRQIASALAAAHEQGVIHRDLKPANIMITPRGEAKVLDFGIAKQLTTAGMTSTSESQNIVGTVPYMAPEQLLGRAVDARTDLFSLGTVLYEMTTGRLPFEMAPGFAMVHSILNETPPPPRELNPALSPRLEQVILRCLEKDPDRRFQSASELMAALKGEIEPAPQQVTAPRPAAAAKTRTLARAWARPLATVLIVAVILAVIVMTRLRGPTTGADVTMAVLPFTNLSRDPEQQFMVDGITDELIVTLSQVRGVRMIARTSSIAFASSNRPLTEINRALKTSLVVTGSVQRSGDRVRLRAELVDTKDGHAVWGSGFDGDVDDVLVLQSNLARQVAEKVRGSLDPADRRRLATAPHVDPEAHQHYMRGRFFWNQFGGENWQRALREFQMAVDRDPGYALAYVGLSDTYAMLSSNVLPTVEAMTRARAAAQKALELSPDLPAALASLAYVQSSFDHQWTQAEANFKKALAINPNEITVLQNYGSLLHCNGRFDEATGMFTRAREIDPLSPYVATMTLWPLNESRHYEETITRARELLAADSTSYYPRFIMGQALGYSGRADEAITEFEACYRQDSLPLIRGWLGWAEARAGHRDNAESILASLVKQSRTSPVQPYAMALVSVGLGRKEETLGWLEHSVNDHWDEAMFLKVNPAWDPVRQDPRFHRMLQQLNLE